MAIVSNDPRNPRIVSGPRRLIYGALEADSQSFKAGQFIYLVAGAVTAAAAGDTPIAGIAAKDATNVSSDNIEIPFYALTAANEIQIQVTTTATLEAANTTCTPGTSYDIYVSSNFCTLNSADTQNPALVYLDPVLDSTGTATYWCRACLKGAEDQLRQDNL